MVVGTSTGCSLQERDIAVTAVNHVTKNAARKIEAIVFDCLRFMVYRVGNDATRHTIYLVCREHCLKLRG